MLYVDTRWALGRSNLDKVRFSHLRVYLGPRGLVVSFRIEATAYNDCVLEYLPAKRARSNNTALVY